VTMKIVVLAAAKGGVGKTTLTAALATAAALDMPESRVGMVDLDPQGSLTCWWNDRAEDRPQLCDLAGVALSAALPALRRGGLDVLFVDCPPGFSSILREAIAVADLVLVPTQPSPLDLAAIASTIEMAEAAGVPHRTVLNRAVFRSRIAGLAVTLLRERGGMLWPPVHQRVEMAVAMSSGHTAQETQSAGAAAREIVALWRSVRAIMNAPPVRRLDRRASAPLLPITARGGA
jgi:chromosome partitioning protein